MGRGFVVGRKGTGWFLKVGRGFVEGRKGTGWFL